jgi:hypothetical protein
MREEQGASGPDIVRIRPCYCLMFWEVSFTGSLLESEP